MNHKRTEMYTCTVLSLFFPTPLIKKREKKMERGPTIIPVRFVIYQFLRGSDISNNDNYNQFS